MNKYIVATIAMGLFLMSTPAFGVVVKGEQKKEVAVSTPKQKKSEKAVKPAKLEKSKRVTLDFDNKKSKPVAKAKTKKAKNKKVVAKLGKGKKNYRSIYCQDGYVINNHAYCLISSAKTKPAKVVAKAHKAKAVKKPVINKEASREVASKKDVATTQRR